MIIRIKKLWCWFRGHKTGKTEYRLWDMVGNPKFDTWDQYHCETCGQVTDFE